MHFFSKLTLRMFLLSLPLWLAGCAHFQDQSLGLPGLVNGKRPVNPRLTDKVSYAGCQQ